MFSAIFKGVNFHNLVPTEKKAFILLHSERPKLYGVLAIVSAVGLKRGFN